MNTQPEVSQETNIIEQAFDVLVGAINYGIEQSAKWRECARLLITDPEEGEALYRKLVLDEE
jgi:hypothetical protein